jgi:hypothetical protein
MWVPDMPSLRIPVLSKLTRIQRILLAAVVVVVVLFVLSVSTNGRNGEGSIASGEGGVVGWLGDLLGGAAAVDPADLSGECLQPDGQLLVDGSCELVVSASDDDVRQIRLKAQDPVVVSAEPPGRDEAASEEVPAGEEITVAVDSDENVIEIACGESLDTCVVLLA